MSETQITVTPAAIRKVFELIQEENNSDLMLRIYISGGGCSGFQYGFMFDTNINADDIVVTKSVYEKNSEQAHDSTEAEDGDGGEDGDGTPMGAVTVLIDAMSYQYLKTAILDYRKDTYGEQFVFRNPQAKTTCGCGSSFAVE